MVMHARSGGRLEIMGLMLGKIDGTTMVVMDAFALPVEGTETRVNAQAAAYEYMSTYIESAKKVRFMLRFLQLKTSTLRNFVLALKSHSLIQFLPLFRWDVLRMRWDGITLTLVTGAGCLVST